MEEDEESRSRVTPSSSLHLESHRSCTIPLKELVGLLAELHRKEEEEEEEKLEARVEAEAIVNGLKHYEQLGESSTSTSTRSGKQQLDTNSENIMGREIFSATGVGEQDGAHHEGSESSKYVWYACYGSNVWKPRFMCYIQGGQVIICSKSIKKPKKKIGFFFAQVFSKYASKGCRCCVPECETKINKFKSSADCWEIN